MSVPREYVDGQRDPQAELRALWDSLDSAIFLVLTPEEMVNLGHARLRALPDGRVLYVDDVDGYSTHDNDLLDSLERLGVTVVLSDVRPNE